MRGSFLPVFLYCALTTPSPCAPVPVATEPGLELRLRAVNPKGKDGQAVRWEAVIRNGGKRPVTLVQPGDGSECGWRTPIIEWVIDGKVRGASETVQKDADVAKAAKGANVVKSEPTPVCLIGTGERVARCGNINRLKANEVFELQPGKEVTINEWLGAPALTAGTHQVRLRYFHIPSLAWKGLPLGAHDEKAIARIKSSSRVTLESNAVNVSVQK